MRRSFLAINLKLAAAFAICLFALAIQTAPTLVASAFAAPNLCTSAISGPTTPTTRPPNAIRPAG